MAKKEVWLCVPSSKLGTSEVEFQVWNSGKKHGTLRVSKGSLVWLPVKARYGHRMSWGRFDSVMRSEATGLRKRK